MRKIKLWIYKIFVRPIREKKRNLFVKCGENVRVAKNVTMIGHVECGNNISIGEGAYFVSTRAKLIIHDNNMFGPNVTIYTGDHAMNVLGRHIIDVTDKDKDDLIAAGATPFDQDVVIEEGCWIGTRAIILKGVTIGKGSIIGAGAVVTRDVPPYSIYVGVPTKKVFSRFTPQEIEEHERLLAQNNSK